jgi:proliferating cell nuclear antigen
MSVRPEDCLLYLRSVQGSAFKSLFEVLREILHDVNLTFNESGMKIMTVDGSRVALVYAQLNADSFEHYRCEGTLNLGVNLGHVHKLIKSSSNHGTITMYVTRARTEELGIEVAQPEKRSLSKFQLRLLDVDVENITIPDVEFTSVITLPSQYFARLCKDISAISDTVTITSRASQLIVSAKGDFASQETFIDQTTSQIKTHDPDEEVSGSYLLKYIVLFNKSSVLSSTMELYLKQGWPLITAFKIASLGELRFILAPKVDDA